MFTFNTLDIVFEMSIHALIFNPFQVNLKTGITNKSAFFFNWSDTLTFLLIQREGKPFRALLLMPIEMQTQLYSTLTDSISSNTEFYYKLEHVLNSSPG